MVASKLINMTKNLPSPIQFAKSVALTIPNSNIYMMAHPHHMEFSTLNWGTYIQFILIVAHIGILVSYILRSKMQKTDEPYIEPPKQDSYKEIVIQNSKILLLFRKTNTPLLLKIDYLIHYTSIVFGVNAIFYDEPEINDISDFILKGVITSIIGLVVCTIILMYTTSYIELFEDKKTTFEEKKKSIYSYFKVSVISMLIALYFCSIFCNELRHYQDNWFYGGLKGFLKTFLIKFFLPYFIHIARKILRKVGILPKQVTSEEIEKIDKKEA